MSFLEAAYASGQLVGLMLEKRAWPAVTDPTVQSSNLLQATKTKAPPAAPPPPVTPETVGTTFGMQEQAKTRLEPRRKLSELDSLKALTESMYATHGPQGVMNTIGANPGLRGQMLGHVKTLAGAASPRPQQGMFSGLMHTQSLPLRAAVSGKIGAEICTTCRKAKHYGSCTAPRPIPEKIANFNPGLTAASSEAGMDTGATSPHYHSATQADSSLARARDSQPADVQAGTAFADLYRHLGITSQTDEPGRMYGGLHKVSMPITPAGMLLSAGVPAGVAALSGGDAGTIAGAGLGGLAGGLAGSGASPQSGTLTQLMMAYPAWAGGSALGGALGGYAGSKLSGWQLWGTGGHSRWEDRGPGSTPNPYEERLTVKGPPVGWGDEGEQRVRRTFDGIDQGSAVDSSSIENVTPDPGPAVGL